MASVEAVLNKSPFLTSTLPPDQLEQQYRLFLESFRIAVETEDDDEESWAYEKCKGAFRRLMGDPPPSRSDPNMPEGFFEAIRWAAKLLVAASTTSS